MGGVPPPPPLWDTDACAPPRYGIQMRVPPPAMGYRCVCPPPPPPLWDTDACARPPPPPPKWCRVVEKSPVGVKRFQHKSVCWGDSWPCHLTQTEALARAMGQGGGRATFT